LSTYRGVGVEVSAHVLNLQLELLLSPVGRTLSKEKRKFDVSIQKTLSIVSRDAIDRTLKAKCSRKCAVPLVSFVSALEPESIHMPTVEVWAQGEYSEAT